MAGTTMIDSEIEMRVMVPREAGEQALAVLESRGISLKDAITLYLAKIIECGEIPFDLSDEEFDWDDPSILRPKIDEDGAVLVPRDWLDE